MTRQVDQIGRLVDDLLEIARLTSGRIELARRKVDLGDLLWELVEANRHLATERSLTVDLLVPDDSIVVSGDPVRLSQVFVNLFRNAVKYTNPHGWIDIRLRREERLAVVVMRDSGIGIDPAMLPSLFEPFTQADRSLARSEGGLGLGLTLVRRLVEMHGGVVEVSSPGPGQGSTFTVRLPLGSDRAVVAEERPAASAPDVHASRRILVVEDSADSAETLAIMLRLAGHQVQIAPDGPSALEAFERYEPSVVILDIGLPGMDGYEVARRLRASHDGRRISLIALTGYGQAEDRRRSAEAGFDHHLVKPVDPVILEELLDSSGNPSES
jgi:CheY-like chemotaxis protein